MTKFEIQELRDLPIEGVAERLGLHVERHKALCPFHDDHTPSLTFRGHKYKCWSCGESDDSISLVMKVLNKDFLDACRWLADEHNVIMTEESSRVQDSGFKVQQKPFDASRYERFFERPWLNEEARKFLFDERHLDERVVRWCRLTSWKDRSGTPWLQIPYFNREGKLIGIQNRNQIKGAKPRFRFPQDSQCVLYNQNVLNMLKPGDELYITEGCSDCWAMLSAGHKAVAIPSATLFKPKDIEQLSIINSQLSISFHMWPDNDAPGERLFMQLKEVLSNLVHHQLPPGCKDFGVYYLQTKTKTKTKNEE